MEVNDIVDVKIPGIRRQPTKIDIPYQRSHLTFLSPGVGPKSYRDAAKIILARDQALPNGEQVISLLHTLYCTDLKNEPEVFYFYGLMQKRWIWIFNSNLAVKDGIYVHSDPKGVGLTQIVSRQRLDKLLKNPEITEGVLFSSDRSVRFAPKETYSQGRLNSKGCSKDGFLIASFDIEGAKKYEEILIEKRRAETSIRPGTYNNSGKPRQTVTALGFYGSDFLGISTHRDRNTMLYDAFGMLKQ